MTEKQIISCAVVTYGEHNHFHSVHLNYEGFTKFFDTQVEIGRLRISNFAKTCERTADWRIWLFDEKGKLAISYPSPMSYSHFAEEYPNIIFMLDKKTKREILDKMPPDGYYVVGGEEGWEDGCFFFNENEAKEYAQQYCADCDDNSYLYTLSHPKKCVPHVSFEWEEI